MPASNPILLTGGFRVAVPAGASELKIKLEIQTFDANVDLGVLFGQDLDLPLESNVDFLSASAGQADEEITITPGSSPALQEGTYFIGLILRTLNQAVDCKITATISGGSPVGTGLKLSSGQSQAFSLPAVTTPGISAGQGGFRINVPQGSSQLRIEVNLDDPDAKIRILARQGFDIGLFDGTPVFIWDSTGSSNSETLVITTNTAPALIPGTIFIAFALDSVNVTFAGSVTATVSALDSPVIGLSTTRLSIITEFGMNPDPRGFTVSNTGGGTLNYALTTDEPWLSVSPESGSSSGEADVINASIDAAGLLPDVYTATIAVSQTDGGLLRNVRVELIVGGTAPPAIGLSTNQIDIDVVVGAVVTTSFSVNNDGGGTLDYTIFSSQGWLSVSPQRGVTAGQAQTIVLIVNAAGLSVGTHSGRLTITDAAAELEQTIDVTANVFFSQPSVELTLSALSFDAETEGPEPPAQVFSVRNSGFGTLQYNISASEPWISVSPTSGTAEADLEAHSVMVSKIGLAPGVHSGRITVQVVEPAMMLSKSRSRTYQDAMASIDVTLTIAASVVAPNVPENAVLNAASFVEAPDAGHQLAPGSIVSVFGTNFGSQGSIGSELPLPIALDGVGVTFDGINAPLFFVGTTQINAQLPFGLLNSTAEMIVTGPGGDSFPRDVPIATFAPGIFTFSQNGSGQIIATYATVPETQLVAPQGLTANSRPAKAGDVLTIWVNGLGPVQPPIGNGRNSLDPEGFMLRTTESRPTVRIGGADVPAGNLLFSGLAPEFVGLYQINLIMPPGFAGGNSVPIQIVIGGVTSRADATIALE